MCKKLRRCRELNPRHDPKRRAPYHCAGRASEIPVRMSKAKGAGLSESRSSAHVRFPVKALHFLGQAIQSLSYYSQNVRGSVQSGKEYNRGAQSAAAAVAVAVASLFTSFRLPAGCGDSASSKLRRWTVPFGAAGHHNAFLRSAARPEAKR